MKSMKEERKKKILEFLKKNKVAGIMQISRAIGVNRNLVKIYLLELIVEGKVKKYDIGKKGAVYMCVEET